MEPDRRMEPVIDEKPPRLAALLARTLEDDDEDVDTNVAPAAWDDDDGSFGG